MQTVSIFDGKYEVGRDGTIYSNVGTRKALVGKTTKDGYKMVILHYKDKQLSFQVHRLVAQAFIPNPENKPWIDHINTIRDDNRVENLRWCTPKENTQNEISKRKYLRGMKRVAKKNKKQIRCIETNKIYNGIADTAALLGIPHYELRACLNGQKETAGGYHWKRM